MVSDTTWSRFIWELLKFSRAAASFHMSTCNVWDSSFSTSLPTFVIVCVCVCVFFFLLPHLWHMQVPRLGVKRGAADAYPTATATLDTSLIRYLCHSLQQRCILNPLIEARGWTSSSQRQHWILNLLSHNGNSYFLIRVSIIIGYFLVEGEERDQLA